MRLLHLADLHLGWQPSGWPADAAAARQRRRDAVLARAVDTGLREGVQLAVIAGDLFDDHDPHPEVVERALSELRRLQDSGVRLVTVPGNHDELTYGDSVYRRQEAWPDLLVRDPLPAHVASLDLAGERVHLYGAAFTGGVTPQDRPLHEFPRLEEAGIHIAVFHGTLGASEGRRSLPLDADALAAARYHYVALGHLHEPLRHEFPAGPAVYPGTPEALSFGEGGCGSVVVVDLAAGRAEVREVAVPVQAVRDARLDLTPVDDVAEIDAFIAGLADPDAVQRVRLGGASWLPELDVETLRQRHAQDFFHLEVVDEVEELAQELLVRWAEEASVRGAFVARMLDRIRDADTEERLRLHLSLRWGIAALYGGPAPRARSSLGGGGS